MLKRVYFFAEKGKPLREICGPVERLEGD